MLRPSKKLALALEAVVDIAFYGMSDPVQSQDISKRLDLPRRYLEQVMQQLVRAGVLKGVRGPRGGYRLARERRRITVGEIIKIVQGIDDAEEGSVVHNSPLGIAVMEPYWTGVEAIFLKELEGRTIEELCQQAEQKGLQADPLTDNDFSI